MSRLLNLLPEAEADAQRAAIWFDQQRPGLGREFVLHFEQALARIAQFPESYAVFRRSMRRVVLYRFNYAVVYVVRPQSIEVIAIMHCRRHPSRLIGHGSLTLD